MLRSGVLLSRFELVSILGRGGMGEVWRARDLRLGRDVAIKVLPEELAREPDRVARFEREARALAALNHPNVAQIYELGEAVPDPGAGGAAFDVPTVPVRFLVMELVEGESLAHRLRGGALPLPDALRVAGQVARGLAAAHARGVIHRDLKPGNVMLAPGGEAKVLDFGLARFHPGRRPPEDVDVTARHGEPGSVVGTAAYMSPEQVRGEECDESCDAWGFGCCLAEMLMGVRAFAGPTVPEIMGRVLDGKADLERLPPETPREVRELLASCLATSRSRRPTLERVAELLEVTAAGKTPPVRRSHRWLAAAAVGVATAVGIGWLASHRHAPSHPAAVASTRLRVALDPVRTGTPAPPAELASAAFEGLQHAVAARKTLELIAAGRSDVRVQAIAVSGVGGGKLQVTLVDAVSGAVIAVLELPASGGGGSRAAAAVAAALELEQVCRELAQSDPLHGFLARRTRVLDAAAAFRDGLQLNARTRLAEAKQAFQRSLLADPGFWPAHLYLALNAKATGHFGDWERELAAARALVPHPDEAEAVVLEEVAAVLSEDSQRRLEAFERARAFFPGSGELTYRAAQAYRFQDRPAEAIPLFEDLLRSRWRPDWSPTREELAFSQLLAGRLEDALRTVAEGEERFPTRFKYPLFAAFALHQLGREPQARAALARAIRKHLDFTNTSPLVVHQVAQYWASLLRWDDERHRQWQAAFDEADKGLRATPGDHDLGVARGEALVGLGRFAEASAALENLAGAGAGDPAVFLALARAHAGLGDMTAARAALDRAGAIWREGNVPAIGTLAYNIAAGWSALGDTRQGFEWLLRARDQYGADRLDLALDPDLDPLRTAGLLEKLPPRR
jgi:tetratricopeptide (TPR) repeat protein